MRGAAYILASIALVAAILTLGGCYMSQTLLLDPAASVRILAAGRQTLQEPDKAPGPVEIVAMADGWYEMRRRGDQPIRLLFNPLPGQTDRFAMVAAVRDGFIYGLAVRDGGRVAFDMTDCDEAAQAEIASRHRARVEPHACAFTDAGGLKDALSELAARPPGQHLPSVPAAR